MSVLRIKRNESNSTPPGSGTLQSGELAYVKDTNKLYIGNHADPVVAVEVKPGFITYQTDSSSDQFVIKDNDSNTYTFSVDALTENVSLVMPTALPAGSKKSLKVNSVDTVLGVKKATLAYHLIDISNLQDLGDVDDTFNGDDILIYLSSSSPKWQARHVSELTSIMNLDVSDDQEFNDLTLTGDLTVRGTSTQINSSNLIVKDKNLEIGVVGSSVTASLSLTNGSDAVQIVLQEPNTTFSVGGTAYIESSDETKFTSGFYALTSQPDIETIVPLNSGTGSSYVTPSLIHTFTILMVGGGGGGGFTQWDSGSDGPSGGAGGGGIVYGVVTGIPANHSFTYTIGSGAGEYATGGDTTFFDGSSDTLTAKGGGAGGHNQSGGGGLGGNGGGVGTYRGGTMHGGYQNQTTQPLDMFTSTGLVQYGNRCPANNDSSGPSVGQGAGATNVNNDKYNGGTYDKSPRLIAGFESYGGPSDGNASSGTAGYFGAGGSQGGSTQQQGVSGAANTGNGGDGSGKNKPGASGGSGVILIGLPGGFGKYGLTLGSNATQTASVEIRITKSSVDADISGSGLVFPGTTEKSLIWKDNIDRFELTGGDLKVGGEQIHINSKKIFDDDDAGDKTISNVSVDASSITGDFDGGTY